MTKAISFSAFVAIALLVTTAAHAGTEFDQTIGNIKMDSAVLNTAEMQGFIVGLNNPHANYGQINGNILQTNSQLNLDVARLDVGTTSYNNSGKISDDLSTIASLNGHTVNDILKFETVANNRTKALGLVADVNTTYADVLKEQGTLTTDIHKGHR